MIIKRVRNRDYDVAYSRKYNITHQDERRRAGRAYYASHKATMRAYAKQYEKEHRNKRTEYARRNRHAYPERYRATANKRCQSTFKNYLLNALRGQRHYDKSINRPNDIDIQYLMDMLHTQRGCCAVTGIVLTHRHRDLRSVSIDRIDSTLGHIKGNIQLVCLFYNVGKGNRSDYDARACVAEIARSVGVFANTHTLHDYAQRNGA